MNGTASSELSVTKWPEGTPDRGNLKPIPGGKPFFKSQATAPPIRRKPCCFPGARSPVYGESAVTSSVNWQMAPTVWIDLTRPAGSSCCNVSY